MNRKRALIIVVAVLALLVVVWFLFQNTPNKAKTATTIISAANYTVENLNNVDVTSVILSIDGVKSGQDILLVPSGGSVSTSTLLSNVALSASTTYEVEFVFTFADGTSGNYSTSCTTPES